VDSNTQLSLNTGADPEVFPVRTTEYEIYSSRSLTLTLYVNGVEYDSVTSEHWDSVETSLSGIITETE